MFMYFYVCFCVYCNLWPYTPLYYETKNKESPTSIQTVSYVYKTGNKIIPFDQGRDTDMNEIFDKIMSKSVCVCFYR